MPTVLETYIENRWMVQPNHSNHLARPTVETY